MGEFSGDGAEPSDVTRSRPRRLIIVTRCESVNELVSAFAKQADDESIFIVTRTPKPLGSRHPFALVLSDRKRIVIQGWGEVIDVVEQGPAQDMAASSGAGPPSGMRLKLVKLDASSRLVFDQLRAVGLQESDTFRPPAGTFDDGAPPPLKMPEVLAPPAANGDVPAPPESRLPFADPPPASFAGLALVARRMEDLTEEDVAAFIQCTLYEERSSSPSFPSIESRAMMDAPRMVPVILAPVQDRGAPRFGPRPDDLPPLRPPAELSAPAPTFGPRPSTAEPPLAPAEAQNDESAPPESVVVALSRGRRSGGRTVLVLAFAVLAGLVAALWLFEYRTTPTTAAAPSVEPSASSKPEPSETSAVLVTAPASASASASASAPAAADCTMSILSLPPGAEVAFNGVALGATPLRGARMSCGAGRLSMKKDGYATVEKALTLDRGRPPVIVERLTANPVKLLVSTDPTDANVTVNRSLFGKSPATFEVQANVTQLVVVSKPGYRSEWRRVPMTPPEVSLEIDLHPLGSGTVDSPR